jgi:hypothetical protein
MQQLPVAYLRVNLLPIIPTGVIQLSAPSSPQTYPFHLTRSRDVHNHGLSRPRLLFIGIDELLTVENAQTLPGAKPKLSLVIFGDTQHHIGG